MSAVHAFDVTGAYTVLAFAIIAAIVLLLLAIHVIAVTKFTVNKKDSLIALNRSNCKLISFLITTVAGILFFECAIVLIIAVLVQLILLEVHQLNAEQHTLDRLYYESFDEAEYLIAIFDSLGHITMLYLFIARFEYAFKESSFRHSKLLVLTLYSLLLFVLLFAALIIALIVLNEPAITILYLEIVWEVIVEFMCVWLLCLFVTKLYRLMVLSFSRSHLFRDLTITIDVNYQKKKEEHTRSGSSSKRTNQQCHSSKTDKSEIEPAANTPPPTPPQSAVHPVQQNNDERPVQKHAEHVTAERADEVQAAQQTESANPSGLQIAGLKVSTARSEHIYAETRDVVNVMNKMTVLVMCMVLSSIVRVVGNTFIELREIQTMEQHTADTAQIWAFLLPVFDMVVCALVLYLQFVFTDRVYVRLCGRLDMLSMRVCSSLVKYCWHRQRLQEEELAACVNTPATTMTTATSRSSTNVVDKSQTVVTPTEASENTMEIVVEAEDCGEIP